RVFCALPGIALNAGANPLAVSNALALALQSETRTIPIVGWTGDPVAAGIVSSLAGGNVRVSIDAGAEMGAKRIELLAEAVGKLTNVRVLALPALWEDPPTKTMREAAEKMNTRNTCRVRCPGRWRARAWA